MMDTYRYSMPNILQNADVDASYVFEMYPKEARLIKLCVDEILDLEDYSGSFIYDEYPDKFLFLQMAKRVKHKYLMEQLKAEECCKELECAVDNLVSVILVNEICHRRKKHRKFFY